MTRHTRLVLPDMEAEPEPAAAAPVVAPAPARTVDVSGLPEHLVLEVHQFVADLRTRQLPPPAPLQPLAATVLPAGLGEWADCPSGVAIHIAGERAGELAFTVRWQRDLHRPPAAWRRARLQLVDAIVEAINRGGAA